VLTGFADADAIAAALGTDAPILRKPFRMVDLEAAIWDALRHRPVGGSVKS
jgi:hypothetical protein